MDFSKMKGADKKSSTDKSKDLPQNVTETKAFKKGVGGVQNAWGSYLEVLGKHFSKMTRAEQEMFILRLSQIVTIGCAVVLLSFFYQFIPVQVRVFAFPLLMLTSWFVATRVVSPIVIAQFEHKLNQ